jgi:DNA-binding IclR family transcriptional regulator
MRALERLTAILEAVGENAEPSTVSYVSTSVGLSLSTTSRLVHELEEAGLLNHDANSGAYFLGHRLARLGQLAIRPRALLDVAPPMMRELRDLTAETVSLHVRRGDLRICASTAEGIHSIRRVVPVGETFPIFSGATGAALSVGLSPDERRLYMRSHAIPAAERRQIEMRIEEVERNGWTLAIDVAQAGLSGIAAPIREDGVVVAALSVSGPTFRWTEATMREYSESLLSTAAAISTQVTAHG